MGLEPTRPYSQRILSPLRLPFRHPGPAAGVYRRAVYSPIVSEQARYVLIGGGVASVTAAQAIREHDAEGRILMIRDEPHVPYDRPPLSKGYIRNLAVDIDDISSKYESFYEENKIDRWLGTRATAIDRAAKTVTTEDGRTVVYEKLLLATGCRAARPEFPGVELAHCLRTMDDAEGIRKALHPASSIVIIGSGYIAGEVASVALGLGKAVTILSRDASFWTSFASRETGDRIAQAFRDAGADVQLGVAFDRIEAGPAVHLADGRSFAGDLVVLGTGILPNVDLAAAAGLETDPLHGIVVNDHLCTADPAIYACGDAAFRPGHPMGLSGEHHLNAKWQGTTAGGNMAGGDEAYAKVPYFWTDFLDLHMILRGHPENAQPAKVIGDRASGEFIELYAGADGNLAMGIALSHDEPSLDPISDRLAEHIGQPIDTFEAP